MQRPAKSVGAMQDKAYRAYLRRECKFALRLATELADSGNTYGRVLLARMYVDGECVPRDLLKAEALLDQAKQLGSADAAYQKAAIYHLRDNSAGYFESVCAAARAGSVAAKTALGRCYLFGIGTSADEERGVAILIDAARKKSLPARFALAHYELLRAKSFVRILGHGLTMIALNIYKWYLIRFRPYSPKLD